MTAPVTAFNLTGAPHCEKCLGNHPREWDCQAAVRRSLAIPIAPAAEGSDPSLAIRGQDQGACSEPNTVIATLTTERDALKAENERLARERTLLADAIGNAVVKAGGIRADAELTGPHLLQFVDELADETLRLQSLSDRRGKALEEALGLSGAIISGSPGPLYSAGFAAGVKHVQDSLREPLPTLSEQTNGR